MKYENSDTGNCFSPYQKLAAVDFVFWTAANWQKTVIHTYYLWSKFHYFKQTLPKPIIFKLHLNWKNRSIISNNRAQVMPKLLAEKTSNTPSGNITNILGSSNSFRETFNIWSTIRTDGQERDKFVEQAKKWHSDPRSYFTISKRRSRCFNTDNFVYIHHVLSWLFDFVEADDL